MGPEQPDGSFKTKVVKYGGLRKTATVDTPNLARPGLSSLRKFPRSANPKPPNPETLKPEPNRALRAMK